MEENTGGFSVVGYIKKYWIYAVLGIFAVNALIVDFLLFAPKKQLSQANIPSNVNIANVSQNICPQSCVDKIDLIAESQKQTSILPTAKPTATALSGSPAVSTPTPTFTPTPTPGKTVKEFFIPLGIGSGNAGDWTVVDGIGAKIDPADYGSIKTVTFEVSARIPTGNQTIWIRLYNSNSYQSVAGSELTLSGGKAALLVSSPITLSSGDNLYQIQMKTQLQYSANIDMARIRIKTN
ncbi:MAG: hypothetical protein Q8P26_05610 [Candidatus Levybacteria bacterium]|nr:hypothetical protein [Candidatus Levybacteria bacterium]